MVCFFSLFGSLDDAFVVLVEADCRVEEGIDGSFPGMLRESGCAWIPPVEGKDNWDGDEREEDVDGTGEGEDDDVDEEVCEDDGFVRHNSQPKTTLLSHE